MAETDWLEIGRIVGPQGLRGELRIYPDTDFPERFLEPGQRWLRRPNATDLEPVTLLKGRYLDGKGLYVVQLEQVTDRNGAEALRGGVLLVPESDRLPLDEGEFYVADLIGLEVYLQGQDFPIGVVVDVYSAGNDLLAVQLHQPSLPPKPTRIAKSKRPRSGAQKPRDTKPVLVPFVPEIVPVVELEAGYVIVDPPAGLFESINQ